MKVSILIDILEIIETKRQRSMTSGQIWRNVLEYVSLLVKKGITDIMAKYKLKANK